MTSVHAYYDGHGYVTEDNVAIKPNQRVIITILDDYVPQRNRRTLNEIKSYTDSGSKSIPDGISAVDYVRQLREE